MYVLVPKLEWTPNRFWDSPIWNIDKSLPKLIRGVPVLKWGLLFWCFLQPCTRLAFSHQKLRQFQCYGAPLPTQNLGNQHTAPANWELGKQEKGWLLLTSQIEGVVQPEAQPHLAHFLTKNWCNSNAMARGSTSTRKNVIFSKSLWTNSEYPISLKSMWIWSL